MWINTLHGGKIVLGSLLILRFRLILRKIAFQSPNFETIRIGNYVCKSTIITFHQKYKKNLIEKFKEVSQQSHSDIRGGFLFLISENYLINTGVTLFEIGKDFECFYFGLHP